LNPISISGNGTALTEFQLAKVSISTKSSPEWGVQMCKYIDSTVQSGYQGYYFNRNNLFRSNRNGANGRVNMQKFVDLLEFNSKTNYANINWQSIKIINRIVSGMVGKWMNRHEKISVTATDPLSVKDKNEQYKQIAFLMQYKKQLQELEQEAGVQLIPQDIELPENQDELNLWVTQFQRLPEEILFDSGINDVMEANGLYGDVKRLLLHDSAEVGMVGTYTWMDDTGVVHIDRILPENMLYSWSVFNDFRDTTWRGQIKSYKVSELRRLYGQEFGGTLSEEELFSIACSSKDYQLRDKITWDNAWNNSTYIRPYDEYNVDALMFEIKSVDTDTYTKVTTKKNKSTILKKDTPKKDNEVAVHDTNINIYEGIYLRQSQKLLKWQLKKNMIRPQDPKEIGNAEFSYSFYMYQNYNMFNVAIPEKIQEPTDQMILARLKMQQLVAKMRPTGAAYDVDALQEVDLGLAGGPSSPTQLQRIYDQTGNLYYRGRDAEGNPIPIPIQELANAGFLNQMKGLIDLYMYHYQVLKDELGEDPALMSQAATPRVTEGNINTAQELADNNTEYIYQTYVEVINDTAKKVACLLKDSVEYGSNAYRALISKQDVAGRIFGTKIRLLPTDQDLAILNASVQQYIAANPDFILFINPPQLMRLAKENILLAETLFTRAQRKMLMDRQQQAQRQIEDNGRVQQESAKVAEEEKRKSLTEELTVKSNIEKMLSENKQKEVILTGIFGIYQKGLQMPSELKGLETEILRNVALPLFAQNVSDTQEIMRGAMNPEMEEAPEMENEEMAEEAGEMAAL